MKLALSLFIFAVIVFTEGHAYAEQERVTLQVENMTCASCPYIVENSLKRIKGVSKAEVSFEEKKATVFFDSRTTNRKALMEATSNAGFPSKVINKKE